MKTLADSPSAKRRDVTVTWGKPVYVLGAVLLIGALLPLVSAAFGVYDHVIHWGKFIHAVDGASATFIFALLLLGWRRRNHIDVSDEFAVMVSVCAGVVFGVLWEIVEFVRDWVAYSDMQKSNTDTMTDFLCNDVAAVFAALVAMRLFCSMNGVEARRLATVAEWLVDGPSRVLDRHGLSLALIVTGVITATVLTLWFAGRQVPGIPIP